MADYTLTYSRSNFPTGVNAVVLARSIRESDIVVGLRKVDDQITGAPDDVLVILKAKPSAADKILLDGDGADAANDPPSVGSLLGDHIGTPTVTDESQKVQIDVPDLTSPPTFSQGHRPVGNQIYFGTHDFADKTTWWPQSLAVVEEILTKDPVDGRIYHSMNPYWISMNRGLVYREDSSCFRRYKVAVTVDGAPQTEYTIDSIGWPAGGEDFDVDFVAGNVKFNADPGVVEVKASYYCIDLAIQGKGPFGQSVFIVRPGPKKIIQPVEAEIQFSKGIQPKDTILFAGYAPLSWLEKQVDGTLDPGDPNNSNTPQPAQGDRYLVGDAATLHANFGQITGSLDPSLVVGDGDVIEYAPGSPDAIHDPGPRWVIIFDASAFAVAVGITFSTPATPYYTWDGVNWNISAPAPLNMVEVPDTRVIFKAFRDYLIEAKGNYAMIPASFAVGPRGINKDVMQLPLNWISAKELKSSQGSEIRIWLEKDQPFTNGWAAATLYCDLFPE